MARSPTSVNLSDETSLIDSILGDADPGDDGRQDEGGGSNQDDDLPDTDDDDATGSVEQQQEDDNDEPDAGDEDNSPDPDEDDLARAARKASGPQAKPQAAKPGKPGNVDMFDLRAKLTQDKAGNLYVNGKQVARGGREARIFMGFRKQALADRQAATKMAQHITTIANGAKELLRQHEALKQQKGALDSLGLNAEDTATLLQVATAYRKSPLDGLKLMLTKAHMAGVDIKSLTGGGGGIDPKTLMEEMKGQMTELLKPVLAETSQRAHQNGMAEEARGFMQRNPRATVVAKHIGGSKVLGKILRDAKERAPDVHIDQLFKQLDYMLLEKGLVPTGDTGPVEPHPENQGKRTGQRKQRSFTKSFTNNGGLASVEDIAKSVLQDIQAANSRGI